MKFIATSCCIMLLLVDSVLGSPPSQPNELGKVMILEYHLIEPQETRWARSVQNFRQDVQRLYDAGYRSISMGDFIDGKITIPAGTKPVIFTFDDSSPGQFRYLVKNGKREVDPDCAVGILLDFSKKHVDFGARGIFFVLPAAKEPHKLFGQPEFEADKLRELVKLGFEVGNHTLWHANLGKYDGAMDQKQIALAADALLKLLPGYRLRALALPFGIYPKDPGLAVHGSYGGITYHYDAVLRVSGPPAFSPFDQRCDLTRLPRIQVPGPDLKYWLSYFEKHPSEAFVSDGKADTLTVPEGLKTHVNTRKFKDIHVAGH